MQKTFLERVIINIHKSLTKSHKSKGKFSENLILITDESIKTIKQNINT